MEANWDRLEEGGDVRSSYGGNEARSPEVGRGEEEQDHQYEEEYDDVERGVSKTCSADPLVEPLLSRTPKNNSYGRPVLPSSSCSSSSWKFAFRYWGSILVCFFFPALGGLLYGYDIGATSDASLSLTSPELSGTGWSKLDALTTGLVVSGSLIGAVMGSVIAFLVGDLIGRRRELMLSAALYCVGALGVGLAPSLVELITSRVVYGLGIGLAMHAAPMYIAETVPASVRGMLISLKEAAIVVGMLMGYVVGYSEIQVVGGWRIIYGFAAPVAATMGLGMVCLPESPRWLLLRAAKEGLCEIGLEDEEKRRRLLGVQEQATASLVSLRGGSAADLKEIRAELAEIMLNVRKMVGSCVAAAGGGGGGGGDGGGNQDGRKECRGGDGGGGGGGGVENGDSWMALLRGTNLTALVIGSGLILFQQMTGQPSVLFYAASIMEEAGFHATSDATAAAALIGLVKLIMTGFAIVLVDRVGRRPLLFVGITGILLSLLVLTVSIGEGGTSSSSPVVGGSTAAGGGVGGGGGGGGSPIACVVALLFYVGCYQLSFGPITWLMVSEIFPLRCRGRAISIAAILNFLSHTVVTMGMPPLEESLGTRTLFLGFAIFTGASLIFVALKVPETAGLTLEEIEAEMGRTSSSSSSSSSSN